MKSSKQLTPLAISIIDTAKEYITQDSICVEKPLNSNRGICIDKIKCKFDNKEIDCKSLTSDPYCAITTYVILSEAFDKINADKSILTKIKTKGALDLLNRFKKYYPSLIDKYPHEGAIFYRKSTAQGSSGHVGIIVYVDDDKKTITTIEGNTSFQWQGNTYDGVWGKEYNFSEFKSKSFEFMNVQYFDNSRGLKNYTFNDDKQNENLLQSNDNSNLIVFGILAIALGGGVYFYNKK